MKLNRKKQSYLSRWKVKDSKIELPKKVGLGIATTRLYPEPYKHARLCCIRCDMERLEVFMVGGHCRSCQIAILEGYDGNK